MIFFYTTLVSMVRTDSRVANVLLLPSTSLGNQKQQATAGYWQCGLIKEIFLFFLLFQFLFLMIFLVLLLTTYLRNHSNLIGSNYKFTCRLNFLQIILLLLISEPLPSLSVKPFWQVQADNVILPTFIKTFSSTVPISPHFRHSWQSLKTSHPSCYYTSLPEPVLCKSEIRAQS